MKPISESEVLDALKDLKRGKIGPDDIPSDFLKAANDSLCAVLTKLFNKILASCEFPKEWKVGNTILLHKSGPRDVIENYRPITTSSSVGKLFMLIITKRLGALAEECGWLGEYQMGFRKNRCTSDCLLIMSDMIDTAKRDNIPLYFAFLDISKAFDKLEWPIIWKSLAELGVEHRFIDLLRAIYRDSATSVRLGNNETGLLEVERGVKQGCVLSPLLFALVMSSLTRKLDSLEGAKYTGGQIPCLLYADDILLCANNAGDLQKSLDVATGFSEDVLLKYSFSKSKIMAFAPRINANSTNVVDKVQGVFSLGGETLELVSTYKYLGITFSSGREGYLAEHEKNMLKRAWQFLGGLKSFVRLSFNRFVVGKALWKCVAVPSLTYGFDALCISLPTLKKLDTIQNIMGRYILGARYQTATEALQGDIGWSSFVARSAVAKLRYKGKLALTKLPLTEHYGQVESKSHSTSWIRRTKALVKNYVKPFDISNLGNKVLVNAVVGAVVNFKDELVWKANMQKKSTLRFYCESRQSIGGMDYLWDNSKGSALLFKSRTDTLELSSRKCSWKMSNSDLCNVCSLDEPETLEHFLLKCPCYEAIRDPFFAKYMGDGAPVAEQTDFDALQKLLFKVPTKNSPGAVAEVKRFLERMWDMRNRVPRTIPT
jgi:hypothetical protein